ncbi:putative signal peptide protein [Puccinia sorghi]|uniref:Putative signal peptide protein n=1 Tax=Puccinia sorghi TaxID=27349 RepID=A0A0L6UE23_9BASI|nr:putative signal peptide protein [Puccinia sorghi]
MVSCNPRIIFGLFLLLDLILDEDMSVLFMAVGPKSKTFCFGI